MKQYRIETHLHTKHTSKCGWLDAAALAEGYVQAGYAAVAVTDHYNRDTFDRLHTDSVSPEEVAAVFLDGFRRMEEECGRRGLRVYRGAELRFDECCNDYLLYNYPDELLARPEEVFHMGIAAFAPLAGGKRRAPGTPAHRRLRLPPAGGHRPGRHSGADAAGERRGTGPASPVRGVYGHRRGMISRSAA